MIERGEAVPGSCFLRPDWPDWQCQHCRHEWFVKDDPARIETERLLADILAKYGRSWPNKPPLPTPASDTPAAEAPVAPPAGAAGR